MKADREIIRSANFAAEAADFIIEHAHKALGERNEFRIALSGGNTPRPVYARLATVARDLPWELFRITFSDERCVPPDDPQSNFRMARDTLFVPAAVPEKSIMRMRGEIDPQIAAQEYEDHLDVFWSNHNPTTLNRQGPDVGKQYRSVIFYHSPEQKAASESSKDKLEKSRRFNRPIVTQIEPAPKFWRAEEYHQRYLEKRGQSHCAV